MTTKERAKERVTQGLYGAASGLKTVGSRGAELAQYSMMNPEDPLVMGAKLGGGQLMGMAEQHYKHKYADLDDALLSRGLIDLKQIFNDIGIDSLEDLKDNDDADMEEILGSIGDEIEKLDQQSANMRDEERLEELLEDNPEATMDDLEPFNCTKNNRAGIASGCSRTQKCGNDGQCETQYRGPTRKKIRSLFEYCDEGCSLDD